MPISFWIKARSAKKFRELDRYPAITRDIAMIVPEKLTHVEILRAIQEPEEPLLESVQLFDLFEIGERRNCDRFRKITRI